LQPSAEEDPDENVKDLLELTLKRMVSEFVIVSGGVLMYALT
jgi:hypothetical protein